MRETCLHQSWTISPRRIPVSMAKPAIAQILQPPQEPHLEWRLGLALQARLERCCRHLALALRKPGRVAARTQQRLLLEVRHGQQRRDIRVVFVRLVWTDPTRCRTGQGRRRVPFDSPTRRERVSEPRAVQGLEPEPRPRRAADDVPELWRCRAAPRRQVQIIQTLAMGAAPAQGQADVVAQAEVIGGFRCSADQPPLANVRSLPTTRCTPPATGWPFTTRCGWSSSRVTDPEAAVQLNARVRAHRRDSRDSLRSVLHSARGRPEG